MDQSTKMEERAKEGVMDEERRLEDEKKEGRCVKGPFIHDSAAESESRLP